MENPVAQRTAWGRFADVVIHSPESTVKRHPAYAPAKAGDVFSAQRLVEALIDPALLDRLRRMTRRSTLLLPVVAMEEAGVNRIPAAMAAILGDELGLAVTWSVVQINAVGHTGASGWQRLARPALFDGDVRREAAYLLVDDFVGQGGTLANLRGYLVAQGAAVCGATVLTGKPYSARLALSLDTPEQLRRKHGQPDTWWRARSSYGFESLTESEGRYLLRAEDADTIRDRVSEAGRTTDG